MFVSDIVRYLLFFTSPPAISYCPSRVKLIVAPLLSALKYAHLLELPSEIFHLGFGLVCFRELALSYSMLLCHRMARLNDSLAYLHPCPSSAFAFLLRDLVLIVCILQT
jgi:hypothetical protein